MWSLLQVCFCLKVASVSIAGLFVVYIAGLFDYSHMQYEVDRSDPTKEPWGEPSLAEMTQKAIKLLRRNRRNGYFLLVEGGGRIESSGPNPSLSPSFYLCPLSYQLTAPPAQPLYHISTSLSLSLCLSFSPAHHPSLSVSVHLSLSTYLQPEQHQYILA